MGNQVGKARDSLRKGHRKPPDLEEEEFTREDIHAKFQAVPTLTHDEKQVLKTSWKAIEKKIETVGAHTFLELFGAFPDTQSVFPKFRGTDLSFTPELAQHGARVMLIVEKVISNIENYDRVWELLISLGRKHFYYGALPMYLELMGPHFVIALRGCLGTDWYEALEYHWLALFNIIIYCMKFGWNLQRADEQKKARDLTYGTGATSGDSD